MNLLMISYKPMSVLLSSFALLHPLSNLPIPKTLSPTKLMIAPIEFPLDENEEPQYFIFAA